MKSREAISIYHISFFYERIAIYGSASYVYCASVEDFDYEGEPYILMKSVESELLKELFT